MTAQRIEGRSEVRTPLWMRALFALQRRLYGAVLEPTRVWARAPAAMRGFVHLYAAVDRESSPLPPSLRSLVMVKVAQAHACAFCIDVNLATLQKRGVSFEKAQAIARHATSDLFTATERAALDYAEAVSRIGAGASVDDATFERLRAFFDDDAIVELTALIALQGASARFNAALRIPAQGFCEAAQPGRSATSTV